jgi:hypothetical protein
MKNRKGHICKVGGIYLPTAILWFQNVISDPEKRTTIKSILT